MNCQQSIRGAERREEEEGKVEREIHMNEKEERKVGNKYQSKECKERELKEFKLEISSEFLLQV